MDAMPPSIPRAMRGLVLLSIAIGGCGGVVRDQRDEPDTDPDDTVETAPVGVPIDPDPDPPGATSGGPYECTGGEYEADPACSDPCAWCTTKQCIDGGWASSENAPLFECGGACDPLAPSCAGGEGCYLVEPTGEFRCMAAGWIDWEGACTAPNDCEPGRACVGSDSLAPACMTLCDPAAVDADAACGGDCVPLADWSYAIEGVGACVFLGG
jgi:hypothetical protein